MYNRIIKFLNNLGKDKNIMLGRWNSKNSTKYMEWANIDNCYY